MWNTITVQYNSLIEEELDEHFKVTCEYGYDFWKTVTFPFLDVECPVDDKLISRFRGSWSESGVFETQSQPCHWRNMKSVKPPKEGQTCMKTSALSAIMASCGVLIAALFGAILVAARGCRREAIASHNAYVPHKGRIK
ncbi:Uncharacterized protein OBRU01_05706 [Operophtera brumata]|uniref:Uncharacterized protein n=1 Tax=Operophtera brumata TaxID=104452 RepID=A0A0L7LLZ4_OPEBR|nr:Uncharacterized protein OBRU01_05706 [Operophtera brumata]